MLVSDLGTLTLKTNPGASAESALLIDGILVVGLAGGTLTAFAARGGAPLWKRKLGTRTGDPLAAFGHLCVLCEEPEQAFLCALDPESGEVLYKKPLPPTRAQAELLLAGDQLVVPGGAGLHLIRARDGERRATLPLPGGAPSRILLSDDLEADAPTLLIRGAAGDLSRRTLDGRALWQRPATEDGPGPLVLAPGVALEGLHAFETTTGRALATLPGPRPDASALLADLTVALHDDTGTLSVHRAAGHLSLV
ncbi:MAG: PQQ-binding-like beta-propeller repeat protein [Deltaproteobacteria bacterium]|nr:PQQ-binding-like beta-propeller repeat protein [Deltaproteobacteria bacterium]